MKVEEYISKQDSLKAALISAIHKIIVDNNKRIVPEVSKMMRQEMIQYKIDNIFMYGLGSGKSHMSLHLLPMYGSPVIYNKYKKLFNKAKFQKGCINFTKEEQMPLDIVKELIIDCSKAEDIMIERYNKRKAK